MLPIYVVEARKAALAARKASVAAINKTEMKAVKKAAIAARIEGADQAGAEPRTFVDNRC